MQLAHYIKSRMRQAMAITVIGFSLAGMAALPVSAGTAGNAKAEVCEGVNLGGGSCNANSNELTTVIEVIVNVLSIIGAVAAVIVLILGGLKYITSNGESSSIASAKTTIIYAIVGLVVIALAQAVVRFVLARSAA
jgi:hypothetical protein